MNENDTINILHIEDDENHAALVRSFLRKSRLDFKIERSENLKDALELVKSHKYDFILSDLYLPDGRSADMIDAFTSLCDCPFIVMSSSSEERDTEEAVKKGATDYIIKSSESLKLLPEMLRKAKIMWELVKSKESVARELANEKEKFEKIATRASDAVILMDLQGEIQLWNSAAERLFGFSESDVQGKNLYKTICNEEDPCPIKAKIVALCTGVDGESEKKSIEFQAMCKDGGKVFVECSAASINLHGEKQILLIARDITYRKIHEAALESANVALEEDVKTTTRDLIETNQKLHEEISRRKTTETILRKNEDILKEAQRIAHVGNWIWDIKSNHLSWSDEIFRIWGFSPQEFEPTYETFLASIHPDDRDAVSASVNSAILEKKGYAIDHRIKTEDGEIKHVRETGELEIGEDGQPVKMIGTVHDISAIRKSEERLLFLAYHDELTGLPNRSQFIESMQMAISSNNREDCHCMAILFMDLDNFKHINDVYGHKEGDNIILQLSKRLSRAYLNVDMIARHGGDAFLFMVSGKDKVSFEAYKAAERILFEVSKPFELKGRNIFVSATLGISTYPSDGEAPEILLQNAEMAMYKAKKNNKSSYQLYSSSMNEEVRRRLLIENRMRSALTNNEFKLFYQPKVNIQTGAIVGSEALIRWFSGSDIFYPVEFIPIAEDTGLINEIGEWVLREACRETATLHKKGFKNISVAVNLSAKQFYQKSIHNTVSRILTETNLDPKLLTLEITENTAMEEIESTIISMNKFVDLGINLSIDDFGTGYSSLSYLKRFPIKELKIDRSFVSEIPQNKDDAAISAAILSLSKSLGLETVAEGVETAEQLKFMKDHGCERVQGYFFSKPVPIEMYIEMLKAGPFITI